MVVPLPARSGPIIGEFKERLAGHIRWVWRVPYGIIIGLGVFSLLAGFQGLSACLLVEISEFPDVPEVVICFSNG